MSQYLCINNAPEELNKSKRINFPLNGANDLTTHALELIIKVKHDNGGVLADDFFPFFSAIIGEITLQFGSGNDVLELDLRQQVYRHLLRRKKLSYRVDKTSGTNKESKLILMIDLDSLGYLYPTDTCLYTHRYTEKTLSIKGGDFAFTNATFNDVSISYKEHMLEDMAQALDDNGTLIALAKKPIIKELSCNGKNNSFTIDFPDDSRVSEVFLYALDTDGNILNDVISTIKVKNAHETRIEDTYEDLQDKIQADNFNVYNKHFDGVAWLNIANGKYRRAINTSNAREKATKLVLGVDPKTNENVTIIAMFETLKRV